ncbi:MAG: helix-turn-helix domain-containing protein [Terriglobales bacterium]
MIQIGARIRRARQERGLSQGDLESRTGLLRCYLSRVENGHTEPSLQTLARLAQALEMPLVGFFDEVDEQEGAAPSPPAAPPPPAPKLTPEELAFLTQMREYAGGLNEQARQQVLGLARKYAEARPGAASAKSVRPA